MAAEETQNQPLEQARDSVLRHGEWVGRELLNFVVLDAGIRLGMKPGLAFTWVRTPGEVIADPLRGEVWLVDFDMVAKIRPCLISASARQARTIACRQPLSPTQRVREDLSSKLMFQRAS